MATSPGADDRNPKSIVRRTIIPPRLNWSLQSSSFSLNSEAGDCAVWPAGLSVSSRKQRRQRARKTSRINIPFSGDLQAPRTRAMQEAFPYQTLISSGCTSTEPARCRAHHGELMACREAASQLESPGTARASAAMGSSVLRELPQVGRMTFISSAQVQRSLGTDRQV